MTKKLCSGSAEIYISDDNVKLVYGDCEVTSLSQEVEVNGNLAIIEFLEKMVWLLKSHGSVDNCKKIVLEVLSFIVNMFSDSHEVNNDAEKVSLVFDLGGQNALKKVVFRDVDAKFDKSTEEGKWNIIKDFILNRTSFVE